MALTRVTSGGIAPGVKIIFDKNQNPSLDTNDLSADDLSISFVDSPTTGIYSPEANTLAFATAGKERLRITGEGELVKGDGSIVGGTNPDFESAQNIMMYVNQSDKNATDSFSNSGGNLNKPFKTIERALLEAARRSYVAGTKTKVDENGYTVSVGNDKFEAYTIMVMPGDYSIDNRPGVLTADAIENAVDWDDTEIANNLWKFNPREGGVIVPRGTSLVGYDLRKTIIRPKYVPKPGEQEINLAVNPAGTDIGGSIIDDTLYQNNILLDAANMIEKSREYIQEQTILFLNAEYASTYASLTDTQRALCKRDVGHFIDGLIQDLREGGNENSFNVGESYTNGTNRLFLESTDEVTATKEAFTFAKELAIKCAHAFSGSAGSNIFKWTDDATTTVSSATFTTDTGSSYAYNNITTSNGAFTLTSTIAKPTFTADVDYSGSLDSTACASVDSALNILSAIVIGIIENPSTYNQSAITVTVGTNTYNVRLGRTQGATQQTAIFKVTGGCYFWQMTFKDAKGSTSSLYKSTQYAGGTVPTHNPIQTSDLDSDGNLLYSHHQVVSFVYANQKTGDGELEIYYKKIDKWDATVDGGNTREPRVEEYEIVGNAAKNTTIDTVSSASPYIFNCSLRSVRGLCGMHADGKKVQKDSFKSMVVAQFTGISLQRDTSAFYQPKNVDGNPSEATNPSSGDNELPIYADPDAEYKPEWRHFHIKASNGAFIQIVSVFAVGYADQFLCVNGGDMSITNSNSNFGHISLRGVGNQARSFDPANQGKITAVIPPRGISRKQSDVEFYGIDYKLTWQLNNQTNKYFNQNILSNFTNGAQKFKIYLDIPGLNTEDDIPEFILESEDHNPSVSAGTIQTKRFLSYGSNNNYLLFRDYYTGTGVVSQSYAIISSTVEAEDGGAPREFFARIDLDKGGITGRNEERQGYFWDDTNKKVYLQVDISSADSKDFLSNFIFARRSEVDFVVVEEEQPDGSILVSTQQKQVQVLAYYDGFPVTLVTKKYVDDRTATPNDLIWRVEYTIPKGVIKTPKPPEKRFIIKGTRSGLVQNGAERDLLNSESRFLIYDVEEVQAWERNSKDGVYYLTVIRADVDKFADSNIKTDGVLNKPQNITRGGRTFDTIKNLYKDSNYRVASNINYLYPSTNEEGPSYAAAATSTIWNPPQSDSRVLLEKIGSGYRCKDISVPNKAYYNSATDSVDLLDGAVSPFADVPSMYSITAESVARLVSALGLYYVPQSDQASTQVTVSPVVAWSKKAYDQLTSNAYVYSNTNVFQVYRNAVRFGTGVTDSLPPSMAEGDVFDNNKFGISADSSERRVCVVAEGTQSSSISTVDDLISYGVDCPLYRPSIIRASSHTWEYVGLGSGNYSTGFPNLQTRVLKGYEQYIVQGYENGGGFVASTGTNSAGDFYIGNQVIQAGGTTTFTLNVPKVRKSSETNYVDISDIENRISNSVINVTASNKNTSSQNFLKSLSNFFTTAKLNVSDRATIQTAIINDRLYLSNTRISNGEKFPEGSTDGYGFVKGARSEKVGFISTDTNDRLYVSPKYLDAWRIKRQLISATAVALDNNRIYLQTPSTTLLDGKTSATSVAIDSSATQIRVKESAGIPSSGQLDVTMSLNYVDTSDYILDGSNKIYLNSVISLNLDYETVDYTNNVIVLSDNQNGYPRSQYFQDIVGDSSDFTTIIKNWSNIIDAGIKASETNQVYLGTRLTSSFTVISTNEPSVTNEKSLSIDPGTNDEIWNKWPHRGAVVLREVDGNTLRYVTYIYYKSTTTGILKLVRRVTAGTSETINFTTGTTFSSDYTGTNNVFFAGCSSVVSAADKWTFESPFIPNTESINEDVDLDSATLHNLPIKPTTFTGAINKEYTDKNVPNPYSAKALGPNLQNRLAVKDFRPFARLNQASDWASENGFNTTDEIELLMKPGYYQLDNATFPCRILIRGSGVTRTTEAVGKERASVSANRIGGYKNQALKRGDSVYFYRPIKLSANWNNRDNSINISALGKVTARGGATFENVHFISLNEAIVSNEILDVDYGGSDDLLVKARQIVRKAWYVKSSDGFPAFTNGVEGGLSFLASTTTATGKAKIDYYVKDTGTTDSDGNLIDPSYTTARYIKFTLDSSQFTTGTNKTKYLWAKNYIIPGSTLYFRPNATTEADVDSSTKQVRIVEVNIRNKDINAPYTGSTEVIEFLCSVNIGENTNDIEDLDFTALGFTGTDAHIVITNKDGDELPTLVFTWGYQRRKSFVPHDYAFGSKKTVSGGTVTVEPSEFGYITTPVTAGGIELPRYDKPEIYGVLAGFKPGTLNLVIDSNPTVDTLTDPVYGTALEKPLSAYPYGGFYKTYAAISLEYGETEDAGVTLNYFPNGNLRVARKTYSRFYLIEISPSTIDNNDNNGINSTIKNAIRNFTIDDLAANADAGGTGKNGASTNYTSLYEVLAIAKSNLNLSTCPYKLGTKTYTPYGLVEGTYAYGRFNYVQYSNTYRYSRKRFLTDGAPVLGNIGGTLIDTSALLGGTNNICYFYNTTIGAQSPYDTRHNRYGGGYLGGLINASGGTIRLEGTRFRGNISIDLTGLISRPGGTRVGSSFTYGHSVELVQVEHDVRLDRLGGNNPAQFTTVSKNDEDFKYLYEDGVRSNLYIESFKTPYGDFADGDRRTFPVKCFASIKRYNADDGLLNTSQTINERYQTEYRIIAGSTHVYTGDVSTRDAGTHMRINRSSTVTLIDKTLVNSSNPITIPPRSIAFKYYDRDTVDNIFYGDFATVAIRASNQFTTYGNVNAVEKKVYGTGANPSNTNPWIAVVTLSSAPPTSIPGYYIGTGTANEDNEIEVTDIADYSIGTAWDDDNSIKFSTNFLNASRYNYISTLTSRYEKLVGDSTTGIIQGSLLRLNSTGDPVYSTHSEIKIQSSNVPNLTRATEISFENTNNPAATDLKALVSTDSSGKILSFDITDFGTGHTKDNILEYVSGTNKIEIKCLRSLEGDITQFEAGEFSVVPPRNCFILNNINSTSLISIKQELQKIKAIIKPFSYIQYGKLYYKVANDLASTKEPYISVYRYVNESNLQDIRTAIVVRLEDDTYAPKYPSTTRFDLFEQESILDYWPASGRVMIGDIELCDFTKGTYADATGWPLTLTRSNTKYWPSYIRDFEGLDPETADVDVSVEGFVATTIALADPIDITCSGLKRIRPSTSNMSLVNISVPEYITPTGIKTDKRAYVDLQSNSSIVDADINKLNIGDIIQIPYRRIDTNNDGVPFQYASRASLTAGSNTVSVASVSGLAVGMRIYKVTVTGEAGDFGTVPRYIGSINTTSNTFTVVNESGAAVNHIVTGNVTFNAVWDGITTINTVEYGGWSWKDVVLTVVAETETDPTVRANKSGSLRIKATLNMEEVGQSFNWNSGSQEFHIVPMTEIGTNLPNNNIYSYVNTIGLVKFQNSTNSVTYSASPSTKTLLLTNALLDDLPTGTQFRIVPRFRQQEKSNPTRIFKSRILDVQKVSNTQIRLHLCDPLPYDLDTVVIPSSPAKEWVEATHYGFFYINHGGWTFPRNAGSNFRSCNIIPGSESTKIKLPNRLGRIRIGDILRYSYEETSPTEFEGYINGTLMTVTTAPTSGTLKVGMEVFGEGLEPDTIITSNNGDGTYNISPSQIIGDSGNPVDLYPYSESASYEYSSTITNVGSTDTNGYAEVTLSNTNNIFYDGYADKVEWAAVDDILVSHRNDNFNYDGPICNTFMYSESGVNLNSSGYRIWFENYNVYQNAFNGIRSRTGWVGNWGTKRDGNAMVGINSLGPLEVVWTRQYNTSIWLVSQPILPRWASTGFNTYISEIEGTNSIETTMTGRDGLVQYNFGVGNNEFIPINQSSLITDNFYVGINTSTSANGAHDAYDIARYKFVSAPSLQYNIMNAEISSSGTIRPGTGRKFRISEQIKADYFAYYKPVVTLDSVSTKEWTSGICTKEGSKAWYSPSAAVTTSGDGISIGDSLYTTAGVYIGTVASLNKTGNGGLFVAPATTTLGSTFLTGPVAVDVFSPKGAKTLGFASNVAPGTAGDNVIGNTIPHYNQYNFKFAISRRNFNATPLVNSAGVIRSVNSYDAGNESISITIGDVCRYKPAFMNVDVTRLNKKVHIEGAVTVSGSYGVINM